MDKKELLFLADTAKHKELVNKFMVKAAKEIMDRSVRHDDSKYSDEEKPYYIELIHELHNGNVKYGSEAFKKLAGILGKGWEHHRTHNDHHPEFYQPADQTQSGYDTLARMNLFQIIEMLCDWIAASTRQGNDPSLAMDRFKIDDQLKSILKNTLNFLLTET